MDHITFSLIIPTYNENMNIIPLLQEVEKVLSGLSFEIIVADDNSPDETWKKVEENSVLQPNVRLIRRMHKPGLSASVIDGFNQARGLYLGVMDADRSHDPVILPRLPSDLGTGADMAVGSRHVLLVTWQQEWCMSTVGQFLMEHGQRNDSQLVHPPTERFLGMQTTQPQGVSKEPHVPKRFHIGVVTLAHAEQTDHRQRRITVRS